MGSATEEAHACARASKLAAPTMLDVAGIPVAELATLAAREGKRPRPVYGAHKWFARRAGSAFRGLMVAASLGSDADFWQGYYGEADLAGKTVLDPFVGGGTSVVEARRLGAKVVGVDVDPVACAVTSFEAKAEAAGDPLDALAALKASVGSAMRDYYRTVTPEGEEREALHFFWVQTVPCRGCESLIEAHTHYQLAHQAEGDRQWVFCRGCHTPHELHKSRKSFTCRDCAVRTVITEGVVERGTVTCPTCDASERLIDVSARTGKPPQWRMFALESIAIDRPGAGRVPMTQRLFHAATDADQQLYEAAGADGCKRVASLDDVIPVADRSDNRLLQYGYRHYRDLFNARQLRHLDLLMTAIDELPEDQREAATLAFSDHLTTNCMLTCYAGGWRRLVPLFAVRAFRHIPRPVEINPWLDGVGRGTYPNALRQVARAVDAAKHPKELLRDGGDLPVPSKRHLPATIVHGAARKLPLPDRSVDLVLTDPPYFDNIDYSELADFYQPWLRQMGLVGAAQDGPTRKDSLAAPKRTLDAAQAFSDELGVSMFELGRVLKRNGRVVFTFRHNTERGWEALANALWQAGTFRCVQVFPLLAEGANKMHTHSNSGVWDAVFVLAKGKPKCAYADVPEGVRRQAQSAADEWSAGLAAETNLAVPFRAQDAENLRHACVVAASLGRYQKAS